MTKLWNKNLVAVEIIARVTVGFLLIASVMAFRQAPEWLAIMAIYPLLTALVAWDPLYAVLTINKRKQPVRLLRLKNSLRPV